MSATSLPELQAAALARITAATTPDELEAVRVEVLGRKGTLAGLSKEMGKLSPEERAALGKQLNTAKQALEEAWEAKKTGFETAALNARLDAEWLDLTVPPTGTLPGSLHPVTQVQREIEELF